MYKDYFRLAYRSATHRKLRSWLTMLGIFIGIAAIVSLLSLSAGLREAIAQQFSSLGSDKLIVQASGGGFGPPGTGIANLLDKDDEEAIQNVNGVKIAVGRLIRIVRLEFNDETKFTYAVTMPKEKEARELVMEANNYNIAKGRFFESDDSFEAVLGHDFAEDFFDESLELRDKILVQGQEVKVVGILKKSGNPQQDSTLVLPESTLRNILSITDDFDIIPLQVEPGENVDVVAERISKTLRKEHNVEEGKEDFTVQTPQSIIATLNTILVIIQGVLVGIAAISLVVGGIGIMNTMYTAVLERTREIGIMKAVGATNREISALFLIEAGFLGLFGGAIGVALGFALGKLVEWGAYQAFESQLIQAQFSFSLLLGALFFAFVVGALSGLYPASQAAKLKPVEALRK
jgi:putative ABC transport system permease protein